MKVLLINPNTYRNPPVIPLGLEYIAASLRSQGHVVEILDLCFHDSPLKEIDLFMKGKWFDLIGITIRNVDSCIYFNNEYFLDDIKKIVVHLKNFKIPVVLGGSGFSASPKEILKYLEASFGIVGPGELAILTLLKDLNGKKASYTLLDGWKSGIDRDLVIERGSDFDYSKYVQKDGILGFETQKGCPNSCTFCIEANTPLHFKKVQNVIEEIKHLVDQGYDHFHLCDSEFNLNLDYSIEFLNALIESKVNIKWALYMKPTPYSEDLFKLLKQSNAYLITLSINSDKKEQALSNYSYKDLKKVISCCKKYEIRLAIDLLIGAPDEPLNDIEAMIEFLKKERPDSVGINFYFRIMKTTTLGKLFLHRKDLQERLSRALDQDENFLNPIFYNQIDLDYVKKLIAGDDLFKIEGFEKSVNYQRI